MMSGKSLGDNSVSFMLYKLMYVLFPLVTSSYVSHVILASGVGKIASAQNIAQYFVLTASLGIPTYGVREIARSRLSSSSLNSTFSELFLINAVSTAICSVFYYVTISVIWCNSEELIIYQIIGISVILNVLNVDWYYQGVEDFAYITKRSFIVRCLSLLAILLFVKTKDDIIIYACIYIGGISGNYLFNCIHLIKHGIHISLSNIECKRHLRPIVILLFNTIAVEIFTMVDVTMLTVMCTDASVGYYSNTMKIVRIIVTMLASIGGVLLPRLSLYIANGDTELPTKIVNKILNIIIYFALPCSVGIFFCAECITLTLFGPSFAPAILTLRISSFLIIILSFYDLLGTQVLLTFNAESKMLVATIVGATVNIIVNYCLIPLFEQNGAAIASVLSQLIVTLILLGCARRFMRIGFDVKNLATSIVASFILGTFLIIINSLDLISIAKLLISVIGGAMLYVAASHLLHNESYRFILGYLIGKLKRN